MSQKLPLSLFEYDLPEELIAQQPAEPRDSSRLLVVDRNNEEFEHTRFRDLPELLNDGDLLVVNRTRVIPARVIGRKPTGGRVELLFHRPVDAPLEQACVWDCLGRPGRALKPDKTVLVGDVELKVVECSGEGVRVQGSTPLWPLIQEAGEIPLPPYIHRQEGPVESDNSSYQTMFAEEPGAAAAPTASLHFTSEVLESLNRRGIRIATVLLHVGPGTFLPVRPEAAEDIREHRMHAEWYEVPNETLKAIEETKEQGGRVISVGTTCVRALETWASTGMPRGDSELFVYPGYQFRVVDALLTNFHLPRSTLLMLVSALAGVDKVLAAYREAVAARYRFFSYGDAMLLL